MPDESAVPTAHLNYQSVYTIGPDPAATGSWSFQMALLPHPVAFLWASAADSVHPGGTPHNYLNSQIAGATHQDKIATFLGAARRWRLTYMSATIYQDGADLSNQGTICATQVPLQSMIVNLAAPDLAAGVSVAGLHGECWVASDVPVLASMQTMPNAYFNRSREGCYLPLHLTRTHQTWSGYENLVAEMNTPADVMLATKNGTVPLPFAEDKQVFPYPDFSVAYQVYEGATPKTLHAPYTVSLCNGVTGFITGNNLAVTTRMSVYVRCGFEIQVAPGSLYTPQLKMSPPHDPVAIENYFQIARQLKDAYPADFNDLGKIWDVISGAAKAVAPFLSAIPGIGPALSGAIPMIAGAGDSIRRALAGPVATSSRDASAVTSATQIQAARDIQAQVDRVAASSGVGRKLKKKKRTVKRS